MFQKAFVFLSAATLMSGCCLFRSDETAPATADEGILSEPAGTNAVPFVTQSETDSMQTPASATRLKVRDHLSPNFDKRKLPVSLVVLHYTAGNLRQSLNALTNGRGRSRVSAHYVVAEDGTIYRLVRESLRAWHAGVSRWEEITDVNSASIGIEIVNLGHDLYGRPRPYPRRQIEAVTQLCLDIQSRYDIRAVVGHSDVAPLRKIDPGELFPWKTLFDRGVRVRARGYGSRAVIRGK